MVIPPVLKTGVSKGTCGFARLSNRAPDRMIWRQVIRLDVPSDDGANSPSPPDVHIRTKII